MKKTIKTSAVPAVLLLAAGIFAAQQASALPSIDGSISFSGSGTLNGTISTATAFTAFNNVKVESGTQLGDYIGTDGTSVTAPGFQFLPALSPNPVTVWSFAIGATTYDFKLQAPLTVSKYSIGSIPFLTISGEGMAQITGFQDTLGSWSLTTQGGGTRLSFSAETDVPDSGLSIAFLGLALSGLGLVRRKLA